jgi:hypothetical protein
MRRITALMTAALILAPNVALGAEAEQVVRSIVFPGWGQYHAGRYTRGTIMMGSAIVTLAAIGGTTLQYNRFVDSYEQAQREYLTSTYIGDARDNYNAMTDRWHDADQMHQYRSILIGVAAGLWVWSALDMAFGPEASRPPIALEPAPDGWRLAFNVPF